MQGAAHEPRLDQAPLLPQRLADVGDLAVDPCRDLTVSRRHELSLGATDLADDLGQVLLRSAAKLVAGADLEQRLVIEDVEAHQRRDAEAIEAHRVAPDRRIEPADASRATGHRAELVAALPDLVPHLVEQLGRERAITDA